MTAHAHPLAALDAAEAASQACARAAVAFGDAYVAVIEDPTPEKIEALRAADDAFGSARAVEAVARAQAMLAVLDAA